MTPDDPRHGTEAGCREHYRDDTKPCPPCLDAHRRRNIMRQLYPHKRPALGTQRRIQALQAIGYGRDVIASELGYTNGGALTYLMNADTLLATTAERIADVYDRLCMTIPTGAGPSRARTWAKRHGFHPPLAWNDPDDPDEQPSVARDKTDHTSVDHAVITRVLAGEHLPTTQAERHIIVRRWLANGGSEKAICDRMGWRQARYGQEAS